MIELTVDVMAFANLLRVIPKRADLGPFSVLLTQTMGAGAAVRAVVRVAAASARERAMSVCN